MWFDPQLPEPVCMGSTARLTEKPDYEKNRIIFANPHNAEDRRRQNVTIKLSYDEGETWPVMRSIEPGASGYLDVAVGPDKMIYCFYERGQTGHHFQTAYLCMARFNLEWLTQGVDRLKK
jgi:sialidase-1